MKKQIWITWEKQRRSIELANAFGCKLFVFESTGLFRYLINIWRTFVTIYKEKPQEVFAQNPSIILAFVTACFLKHIFSFKLIIDRHSNFLLTPKKRSFIFEYFFHFLSYSTIKYADLTIVTNEELAHVIKILGGNPFVLPDKIPSVTSSNKAKEKNSRSILLISSFAEDEPIEDFFQAISMNQFNDVKVYISGNYKKLNDKLLQHVPENVTLTGFLPDDDFIDLLFQVEIVIVLTKMDYTLLCGCYEAIAAEKPLITSNTNVLKNLFYGATFVNNDPDSITNGISKVLNDPERYRLQSVDMKNKLTHNWNNNFQLLKETISNL